VELRPTLESLPPAAWKRALQVQECLASVRAVTDSKPAPAFDMIPPQVQMLLEARQQARANRDWLAADNLRSQIAALGWKVVDTPAGPQLVEE
jgi:cysteinyl-tRNA synthetase